MSSNAAVFVFSPLNLLHSYRLMLRRCLQTSNPAFGMVMPLRTNMPPEGSEYGTMLEIQSVQMLPDGRSMVETKGTHRFRILERGTLDGYAVARIQRYVFRHHPSVKLTGKPIPELTIAHLTQRNCSSRPSLHLHRHRRARLRPASWNLLSRS